MTTMTGISVDTFVAYGGVTGSASTAMINRALQIAWDRVEDFIGSQLYPYTVSNERHPWPANGRLQLEHRYLSQVNTVTARHDEETCSCDTTDYTGCAVLLDLENSIIDVKECYAQSVPCSNCACSSTGRGTTALISYVAGLSHPLSDSVLLALVLLAKDNLAVLTDGVDEFAQMKQLASFRSMDYSESYAPKNVHNRFSTPTRADLAFELLRQYRDKRAVAIANPRKARIA